MARLPKLNKSETFIWERLKRRPRYTSTAATGRRQGGQRDYNACLSLVSKGLARLVRQNTEQGDSRSGYTAYHHVEIERVD